MSESSAAANALPPTLHSKAELEAAMLAAPEQASLRQQYFDLLHRLTSGHSGLLWAMLPEVAAPLALRAGTPDAEAFCAVFRDAALAMPLPAAPQRILILGGYAGYTAVSLALRFPGADIAVAEPLPDNLRLLRMNTAAWPRIQVLPAAAWHSSTTLAASGRFQADWLVHLSDSAPDAMRHYPAHPVGRLIADAGWDCADLLLCDAAGAERAVFADPRQGWLDGVDAVLVRPSRGDTADGEGSAERALPEAEFERGAAGEYALFSRRKPRTRLPPGPPPRPLLRTGPGLAPHFLVNVPAAYWGFHIFDGSSFQLHPNPQADQPSRAVFVVTERGYTRFVSGLRHDGQIGAHAVVFSVFVVGEEGAVLARAATPVPAQTEGHLTVDIPPLSARYRLVLQTEMIEGAPDLKMAWARWIDPTLR